MDHIDLTPLINDALQLAGTVLFALGSWAVSRLVDYLGLKNSAQTKANFDDALRKAITFGLSRAEGTIVDKGWEHPAVKNETIATALAYMNDHFGDTIKSLKLSDKDKTDVDVAVTEALNRTFPQAAKVFSESPVTPPVPVEQRPLAIVVPMGAPA